MKGYEKEFMREIYKEKKMYWKSKMNYKGEI